MLGKVAGYGKKIKLVITGLASICEVMHSESGRHSDYTIFLIWNNTPSIELGIGRRFSIATHSPSMTLGLRLARLALLPGH